MAPLPFINRIARTAEGRTRFGINCKVKYKKPLLSADELAIINSCLAAKAKTFVAFPEFGINRDYVSYTLDRQLAGGESF